MKPEDLRLKNRDISWLAFNQRVLQEAADPTVPLYERIKFLAIWSSNLDEFFRVRIASLRALQRLKKKTQKKLDVEPETLLPRLLKAISLQQEEFTTIFRRQIKRELNKRGIFLVADKELKPRQREYVAGYFRERVQERLQASFLSRDKESPFLENNALYLVARLRRRMPLEKKDAELYALVAIPPDLPRFVVLPRSGKNNYIMFIDDVIRVGLPEVFPNHDFHGSYAIKLTRDAELYIEDEFNGDLLDKVKKALGNRRLGIPARFLFDSDIPKKILLLLKDLYELNADDLVNGSRYLSFNDLFVFPNPDGPLTYEPVMPIVPHEWESKRVFEQLQERDVLLNYPYHSYGSVLRFLKEAGDDPAVQSIKITLYRVAKNSQIAQLLIRAAQNGKQVTAFIEVKARFDEESNIHWAEEMEKAGARVLYSLPNLKVHAKLCLIRRREDRSKSNVSKDSFRDYGYLSTGNFNEDAAKIYTDFGLFTADERLTGEVEKVFEILCREKNRARFEHLLVAPYNMRERFAELIDSEIRHAAKGEDAFIVAKMNSLEDPEIIAKLCEANAAGVRMYLIVRGICCLIPGIKGMSENIQIISIVDRFLEHARMFFFHNGGNDVCFLSSADWMKRNLDRRIEVAFPIYDEIIRKRLRALIDLQLTDSVKARVINKKLDNKVRPAKGGRDIRSQHECYEYWKSVDRESEPALPARAGESAR